jgi:hypothetical protein
VGTIEEDPDDLADLGILVDTDEDGYPRTGLDVHGNQWTDAYEKDAGQIAFARHEVIPLEREGSYTFYTEPVEVDGLSQSYGSGFVIEGEPGEDAIVTDVDTTLRRVGENRAQMAVTFEVAALQGQPRIRFISVTGDEELVRAWDDGFEIEAEKPSGVVDID